MSLFVSAEASAAIPKNNSRARPLDYTFGQGYDLAGSDGGLFNYGDQIYNGGMAGHTLAKPIVGIADLPGTNGYWQVGADGGVFAFGSAGSYGSMGGQTLNAPVVGIATTRDGAGYWLVGSDGGIYAFGDAGFYGSEGGQTLTKPIVGMAATTDGRGYWLVASDGGIFAFGDAAFQGSEGGVSLPKPIIGMAANPNGTGYWLAGQGGAIYSFGDAIYYGGAGSTALPHPIVGIAPSQDGQGYVLAASDGGALNFGDAEFLGAVAAGTTLGGPIVGISATNTLNYSRNLATNGGFENGLNGWTVQAGTNTAVYGPAGWPGEGPYQGNGYEAMNSTSSGGIIQKINTPIAAGDTYCVSAELASRGWTTTATGALSLFMLGTTAQETSSVSYGPLPGQSGWTYYQTCVMATTAHTQLQVQFYLGAGNTTVDNVAVTLDLAHGGGFNNGTSGWTLITGGAYANYTSIGGEVPYEGTAFEAMGTSGYGAYQTRSIAVHVGERYCAAAELASQGTRTDATGSLSITLSGGTDTSSANFGPLQAGSTGWKPLKVCVTATSTQSSVTVRITTGASATTVDDVNVT